MYPLNLNAIMSKILYNIIKSQIKGVQNGLNQHFKSHHDPIIIKNTNPRAAFICNAKPGPR